MARKRKTNTKVKNKAAASEITRASSRGFSSQVKLSDSYISLFLGIVVVVGVVALALTFSSKGRNYLKNKDNVKGVKSQEQQSAAKKQRTYTVQDGEGLWSIAEKIYGSGFNWIDIAQANNLKSADDITTGMVLKIPDAPKRTGE